MSAQTPASEHEHFSRLRAMTGLLSNRVNFPSPNGTLFTSGMVFKLVVFLARDYSADVIALYIDPGYTDLGGGVLVLKDDKAQFGYRISFGESTTVINWTQNVFKKGASGQRYGKRRPFTLVVDRQEPWTYAQKIELELVAAQLDTFIARGELDRFMGRWRRSWASIERQLLTDDRIGSAASNTVRALGRAMAADASWYFVVAGSYACADYGGVGRRGASGYRLTRSRVCVIPKHLMDLLHTNEHAFYVNGLRGPLELSVDEEVENFVCVPVKSQEELVGMYVFAYGPNRCLPPPPAFKDLVVPAAAADKFRYLTQRRFPNVWLEPIYKSRNTNVTPKKVAVLMPFTEGWSERIWAKILRPHLGSLGLTAVRADDLYGQDVMEDIWSMILDSELVIADITGRNANVFYELGLAHTIGKPVILIAQATADIPFDLNRYRHVIYQDNLDGYERLTTGISGGVIDALKRGH